MQQRRCFNIAAFTVDSETYKLSIHSGAHSADVSVDVITYSFDIEFPSVDEMMKAVESSLNSAFALTKEILYIALPEILPVRTGYLTSFITSNITMINNTIRIIYPYNRPFVINQINYLVFLQEVVIYCINHLVHEYIRTNPTLTISPIAITNYAPFGSRSISSTKTSLDVNAVLTLSKDAFENSLSPVMTILKNGITVPSGEIISIIASDLVSDKRSARRYRVDTFLNNELISYNQKSNKVIRGSTLETGVMDELNSMNVDPGYIQNTRPVFWFSGGFI